MSRWFSCFRSGGQPAAPAEDLDSAPEPTPPANSSQAEDFSQRLASLRNLGKREPEPAAPVKSTGQKPSCTSDTPIIAATIYGRNADQVYVYATFEELNQFSWLYRRQAGEFIRFGCRQVAGNTQPGQPQSILPDKEHSKLEFVCHGYCDKQNPNLVATMVTAPDYPPIIVYRLLCQLLGRFQREHKAVISKPPIADTALEFPSLKEFVNKYQDPAAADFGDVHKGLKDTTEVLFKAFDQVIARGEKLEDIMAKSSDLSDTSKAFYKTSKKTRCCTIL